MIRTITIVMTLLFMAAGLAACGGGDVSTGAGGSKSAENLVVKVNSNGTALFQSGPGQENWMLATFADFLISEAKATEPQGHTVTVYDALNAFAPVADGVTDENGEAKFTLNQGSYRVCIDGADPSDGTGCVDVEISGTSVVTATVTCDTNVCSLSDITEEDVTSIQDPDKPHKVIICHIPPGNPDNQRTLSVDQESLQDHLDHGDTPGECPEPELDSNTVDTNSDNGGNGNNGNNGNRPNQD